MGRPTLLAPEELEYSVRRAERREQPSWHWEGGREGGRKGGREGGREGRRGKGRRKCNDVSFSPFWSPLPAGGIQW